MLFIEQHTKVMIFYQRRTIDSMNQRLFIVIDKMLSNCGTTLMHELPSSPSRPSWWVRCWSHLRHSRRWHHLFLQLRAITLPQSPSGRFSLHRVVRYGFQPDHSWIDTFLSSQPCLAGYSPPSSSGRHPPDPSQYTFSVYSDVSRLMENRPP